MIRLAMIVKDEADSIERCLTSALPFIDAWTILDTGSTDGTPEVIERTLADVPGELHHGEFVNFGVTRSELMRLASEAGAAYLMLLDADMEVVHPGPLPPLFADVCEGRIKFGVLDYTLPILVKADREWRYDGVAHSYLASDDPFTVDVIQELSILDYSHTGPEKLRRDLDLLSAEHARNPLDARTAFYLAQTFYDLGMIPEAISTYRVRVNLDGWDEETYYARYRLGVLLCEHVSFAQGARELLAAWEMRPSRNEALRALSNVAENVADKVPYPIDRLFVHATGYPPPPTTVTLPPCSAGKRRKARRYAITGLSEQDVSAVIVTRGNVDLSPILETIPYDDVVVWNNAERETDLKLYGRYAAIPETKNPVIYWQDDDIVFTDHARLRAAYEPGRVVCNMDAPWVEACGYEGKVGMVGAGSLCDAGIPAQIFARYFERYAPDDDFLVEADFVLGTMASFDVVDLGYVPLAYTDDADRLYRQPGQHERKWRMIERCLALAAEGDS